MRIKRSKISKTGKKKLFKSVKGYRGSHSKTVKKAIEAYYHAGAYAYAGRKNKKRDFRKLWIVRINAASRMFGLRYNELMYGLKVSNVNINRKVLADLAINDIDAFKDYVEIAKKGLEN